MPAAKALQTLWRLAASAAVLAFRILLAAEALLHRCPSVYAMLCIELLP